MAIHTLFFVCESSFLTETNEVIKTPNFDGGGNSSCRKVSMCWVGQMFADISKLRILWESKKNGANIQMDHFQYL